jgi:hypothetical protein
VVSQCGILRRSLRASFVLIAALAVAFAFAPAAFAQIVVSNTASSGAGSLTAAITAANASPGSTITFNLPANSTITLNGPLPAINANVTIDGSGSAGLTLSGGNSNHVFFVLGGNATFENLTIANGNATGGAGGSGGGLGAGGAIFVNAGTTTITNVSFSGNGGSGGVSYCRIRDCSRRPFCCLIQNVAFGRSAVGSKPLAKRASQRAVASERLAGR